MKRIIHIILLITTQRRESSTTTTDTKRQNKTTAPGHTLLYNTPPFPLPPQTTRQKRKKRNRPTERGILLTVTSPVETEHAWILSNNARGVATNTRGVTAQAIQVQVSLSFPTTPYRRNELLTAAAGFRSQLPHANPMDDKSRTS